MWNHATYSTIWASMDEMNGRSFEGLWCDPSDPGVRSSFLYPNPSFAQKERKEKQRNVES